jgi:uncharacterized membrane protein YhaH (DUF805 family)
MNIIDAVRTCFIKCVDSDGRAGRPEFWWFILFSTVLLIAFSAISSILTAVSFVVSLVPYFAVTTRRLHDTNHSGQLQLWWSICMITGLVMSVFGFASMMAFGQSSKPIFILGIVIMLASFTVSVYFMLKAGDPGDNKYGAPTVN